MYRNSPYLWPGTKLKKKKKWIHRIRDGPKAQKLENIIIIIFYYILILLIYTGKLQGHDLLKQSH